MYSKSLAEIATKKYVDEHTAGGTGVSATALKDSLNKVFSLSTERKLIFGALDTLGQGLTRMSALNDGLAAKLGTTAFRDSANKIFSLTTERKLVFGILDTAGQWIAAKATAGSIRDTIDAVLSLGVRSVYTAGRFIEGIDSVSNTGKDIDWSTGNVFFLTLGSTTTLTFSNVPGAGKTQTITIFIYNTVGNYTVAWPSTVRWSGGTAPVITVGTGKYDVITLVHHPGRGTQSGSFVQNFSE